MRKLALLGTTARLAELPPGDELARTVDPRSISSRQAALGLGAAGHGHGHVPVPGQGKPVPKLPRR